jgi:hypothetical protein
MAATITVGRAGTLGEAVLSTADLKAGKASVKGTIVDLDYDKVELTHVAEQFAAYVDSPDEAFVPVLWSGGPSVWDGFYRVEDVQLHGWRSDVWEIGLELERVQGFAAPLFEAIVLGGKRAGVAAAVAAQAWQSLPATVMGYENGTITPTVETVASADGNLRLFTDAVNKLFNARVEFYLPPASWYVGAATLTIGGKLIVGRQCPNDPDGWALSNGIVRLSGVTDSGAIKLEHWSGTAWVEDGSYWFGQYGGGAQPLLTAPPLAITVLRNGPECVTIRLAYDAASIVTNARFAVNVDVSLRRGANCAEVYLSTRGAYRWMVKTEIDYATAVSGGGASADPATGVGFALGNTDSIEPADPKAFALAANDTYMACGIGHVFGTVNATSVGVFGSRYASAQSERVLAVAR